MSILQGLNRAHLVAGNRPAVIEGDVARTWSETVDRIARLAQGLGAVGVSTGDRVAVLASNSIAFFETYCAVAWAGAVLAPLNTRLAPKELAFQLRDAGASLLAYSDEYRSTASALHAEGAVTAILAMDGADPGGLEALVATQTPAPCFSPTSATLAGIYYTGGTTGLPKGVMLTHGALQAMAINLIAALKIDEDCINFHSAPMFHLADLGTTFVTMLGGTHVFQRSFEATDMLKAIAAHGVTHCFTVPVVIDRMAAGQKAQPFNLASLRMLGYGGSPMPAAVMERARAAFPGVEFVQGFGQTELPACTYLAPKHHRPGADPEKLKSAGLPCFGYELAIVDEHGARLGPRQVGEIIGRGANMMSGYWNRPEETAKTLRDGWVHTGDAGFMDEDGFLYITDRLKDMIVSGAENVYSIEVESVLSRHPAVLEAAVIGVPDEKWGERVHAVLVVRENEHIALADIVAFCRSEIAGYKCPRSIETRSDPLPRNAAGKIMKGALRDPHWAGRDKKI